MGRRLDAFFGRTSKQTSKLKNLLTLSVSRLAVLRNQRQYRCSQATGDVAELLSLGHRDRALLRVEQVIKEQNMLDVFVMVDGYCHLLLERAALLDHQKVCPEELREAAASLVFAGSRCGDLPELQDVRRILAAMFGKEFTNSAVELRNNCGVNTKMIQKLSTRQPSIDSRVKVAKEIAMEKGINISFDDMELQPSETPEAQKVDHRHQNQQPTKKNPAAAELDQDEQFTSNVEKVQHKYMNAASAAQAAFESAAYAAAAARAAVELSRSESQGKGPDDQSSPRGGKGHGFQDYNRAERNVETTTPKKTDTDKKMFLARQKESAPVSVIHSGKQETEKIMINKSDNESEEQMDFRRKWNPMIDSSSDEELDAKDEVINPPPPPYYIRNPRRYTEDSESYFSKEKDKFGLSGPEDLNAPDMGYPAKSSQIEKKVLRNPVSMRTRRGFQQ